MTFVVHWVVPRTDSGRPGQGLDSLKVETWKVLRLSGLLIGFLAAGLSTELHGHQSAPTGVAGTAVQAPSSGTAQPRTSASITGTIRDTRGDAVPGVRVTLLGKDDVTAGVVTASSTGAFAFSEISPGTYQVKIDAAGVAPFASASVTLAAGDNRELPIVSLRIPPKITTVNVTATLDDVAQEQVKEEEKQRIFGFMPNYYTSYIWNAAPLKPKLKFQLAIRTAIDPATLLVVAGVAGTEQAHKTFPGYGQGAQGYAKRFGASYADTLSARVLASAVFPTLLHQDPRYFYKGSGTVSSRVAHALLSTVICRGDNGQLEPNYSHVLGSFAAAGLSNVYRTSADRQATLTLRNGLIITASGAAINLLREFVSRRLTPSVPQFAHGKP